MKRIICMIIGALLCFATAEAQQQKRQGKVYDVVEVMPEYPGGMSEMMNFLHHNVRYPEAAMKKKIQGRSVIRFVVEKDGSLSDFKVVRSAGSLLDAEALRVAKSMPKWKPGKMKGKTVRVKYMLPVSFRLE